MLCGLVSCWGASLVERRGLRERPYGVFSQGRVGVEIMVREERGEETVQGLLTRWVGLGEMWWWWWWWWWWNLRFVMHRLAGQEVYLSNQQL